MSDAPIRYIVVVRGSNGQLLKVFEVTSRYAAKRKKSNLESIYDEAYSIGIEPVIPENKLEEVGLG